MTVLKYSDLLGGSGTGTGTVTSVSGTGTVSGLTLTGNVTSSGSLTLGGTLSVSPTNFGSQTSKYALIAPAGSAGVPTFRQITWADLTSTPTTIEGYSVTNVYNKTEIDNIVNNISGGGGAVGISGRYSVKVVFTGGSPSSVSESNFPTGWTITPSTGKVRFAPTVQVAKAPVLVTFYAHITANNTNVLKFPLNSAPVSVSSDGIIDISLYSYDVGADANGGYAYVNILF